MATLNVSNFVLIIIIKLVLAEEIYRTTIFENNIASTSHRNFSTSITDQIRPYWFKDAIKDIAYYLRSHKFNEFDRRYYRNGTNIPRTYYRHFSKPPLRSLHWEVRMNCESSFMECMNYLRGKIKGTALKRQDDTSIVVQENKWNFMNNSRQISQTDMECRKTLKTDFNIAPPFEGPLERYQWRATASYYMCWYTMNEIADLAHVGERCDNFAYCMDMTYGPTNEDPRADDSIPFACAQYSFCPDPCCANKHLKETDSCWNDESNPCFDENPLGQRQCLISRSENIEFTDLILNRWNVSCKCLLKGYSWSSLYGICVDSDECVDSKNPKCTAEGESCLNLPGSFKCICKWGYYFNSKKGKCVSSETIANMKLESEDHKNISRSDNWKQFMRTILKFLRKSKAKRVYLNHYSFIVSLILLL